MMCKVGSVPVVNSYGVTVHLRIKGIEQDGKREACRGGLLGQFPPQSVFHYGDELVLDCAIVDFSNDEFYALLNRIQGLRQRCVVLKVVEQYPARGLTRCWGKFLEWREILADRLVSGIDDDIGAAMYAAMMLGLRNRLATATRETFVRSASVHLFSISGLHVTMLCMCIMFFIRCSGLPLRYRTLLALPVLLGYVLLSGGAPSALRSYFMVVGASLAILQNRRHCNENSLALSALLLLAVNPLYLLHSGFLFSFILVTTLLRSGEPSDWLVETLCERRLWLPMKTMPRRWRNWMRNACAVFVGSVVAWYGSCGLMMHFNCMLSFGSLFVNALLAPFATILVFAFFPKIALGLLWSQASILVGRVLTPVLRGLYIMCQIGATEGLYRETPALPSLQTLCYYLLLFMVLSGLQPKRVRLAAFIVMNLMIAYSLLPPKNDAWLFAVNGEKSRPACVAYISTGSQTAVILQPGSRSSLKKLLNELKQRGFGGRLQLVMTDIYATDWSRELEPPRITDLVAAPKMLEHRRNSTYARLLRASGTHVCAQDNDWMAIGACKVKIDGSRVALQHDGRELCVENDEGGTTRLTLPDGTIHELPQGLKQTLHCWKLERVLQED
ncbi:MAG: ComEC/Rec2 family competence protein [Victivallales bacterium]|nr:ComEC/Rec2 family competence protein [Victivallales bacterium]